MSERVSRTSTLPSLEHLDRDELLPHEERAYDEMVARREEVKDWARKLKLHEDDLEVFLAHKFSFEMIPPLDGPNRRGMLAYLKKKGMSPPKWLMISGLYPECGFEEPERRKRLRALHKATVLLIRRALGRCEADAENGERSVFWEPVAEVCRDLEIAPSKISALMKEFCGHSLSQMIDCVKVERVPKMMRKELKEFVAGVKGSRFKVQGSRLDEGDAQGDFDARGHGQEYLPVAHAHGATLVTENSIGKWEVWKALKASRKWPEFGRDSWANGFGFANYRRMYRAFVAVFGKTPHQVEMGIIGEELGEVGVEGGVGPAGSLRSKVAEFREFGLKEVEEMVRGIQEYSMG